MTSQELIDILKAKPSAKIYLASDEEGNSFGDIDKSSIEIESDKIIIYPYHQFLEID